MKTLIAVPCFDMVHADFTKCLMELDKPAGTGFAMIKNTLIYTARNTIAVNALKAGFDRVMWIDSDVVFPPDTLKRLAADVDEGREFVTGMYFTRKHPIQPVIYRKLWWEAKDGWVDTGLECYEDYPENRIFEIEGCGFGLCMTSARILEAMNDSYGAPFYPLMGMGEDTTFCWRAKQEGFSLWCDSSIQAGHCGQTIYNEAVYRRRE